MVKRGLDAWVVSVYLGTFSHLNSFGSASKNGFAMSHLPWDGGAPVNTPLGFQAWIPPLQLHPDAWSSLPTGGDGKTVRSSPKNQE